MYYFLDQLVVTRFMYQSDCGKQPISTSLKFIFRITVQLITDVVCLVTVESHDPGRDGVILEGNYSSKTFWIKYYNVSLVCSTYWNELLATSIYTKGLQANFVISIIFNVHKIWVKKWLNISNFPEFILKQFVTQPGSLDCCSKCYRQQLQDRFK